jgi:hypothetical protein
MPQQGGAHTVHFGNGQPYKHAAVLTGDEPVCLTQCAPGVRCNECGLIHHPGIIPKPAPSSLSVFLAAQQDIEHIREVMKALKPGKQLHGDLQSAKSAAIALQGRLDLLIDAEGKI